MRAALVVLRVGPDPARNLRAVERWTAEAAGAGAGLVVFPEAALTGLGDGRDGVRDRTLGLVVPGPATDALGMACRRHGTWMGIGLLERDGRRLHDTAVLLAPDGQVRLRYRRVHPGWHAPGADPEVYAEGSDFPTATTPSGTLGFLLCGDLFDDRVVARFRESRAEALLLLLWRSFEDGSADPARWDREELPDYAARVRAIARPTLMVNALTDPEPGGDRCFGGAFAFAADGRVLAAHPLGVEGMLLVDLP